MGVNRTIVRDYFLPQINMRLVRQLVFTGLCTGCGIDSQQTTVSLFIIQCNSVAYLCVLTGLLSY